jgi:hypothetical protein
MRSRQLRTLLTVIVVVGLGLAACGDDTVDPPDATASPTPAPTASPSPTSEPTATPSPTPTPTPTPTGVPDPSPSPLAGVPYDGPPTQGRAATLAVVGVAADDVLNVRAGPGTDQPVVGTLEPLAADVTATGRARQLPASIWLEVDLGDQTGWSSSRYLAFLGPTDDVTSQVVDAVGALPTAETLVDLAADVAAVRASVDPASRIVISDGPAVGDLGEVTVDVVGLGDDSVFAERLVVFATPDASGEGFTVKSIEATLFCGRGPALDGLCP